jgi:hypothetical protein
MAELLLFEHHPLMKPLQIYVNETEMRRLEAWSRQRGWSKSQAVRAAIRAMIRSPEEDPVLGLSGMVQALPPDASADFDRYLAETFVAERPQRS